ncbi:MAG: LPS assembly protein LptD [Pseudomarimonas sp.]
MIPKSPLVKALALACIAHFAPSALAAESNVPVLNWQQCSGSPVLDWIEPIAADPAREQAATDIDADSIDVSGKDVYVLEGDARLRRADQRLRADRLQFTHSTSTYAATGAVRYQDSGVAIAAASVSGNVETEQTRLTDVRYQLVTLRGNGQAASADLEGATGDFVEVSYSTCDAASASKPQSWVLRAASMYLDQDEGVGSMRNASLRIGNVPVLWLPYASFPIDNRRKSGFLYPSIGSASDTGIDLRIPYYLNIAPNHDATLSARIIGRRGVALGGEYRYLYANHGGQVEGDWLPDDDQTGRDRSLVRFRHAGRLGASWNVNADVNRVSDDRYFEDFGDSLSISSTSLLGSSVSVDGRGDYWKASVAAERWDIIDPLVADSAEPYRRLPRARYRWQRPVADWLQLRLDAEAIAFGHRERAEASRYDLRPSLSMPFERAWGYVRPEFGWRQTGYSLDREFAADGFADTDPSRGVPISSLDAALNFERDTRLFGDAMRQTLQPRLYYLHVPFENQDDLPIFDTQELSFSYGQLFRPNRFTGADRQTDANQATFAVTTRFFENASGRERLSASIGQIRYFEDQRVQVPGATAIDGSGSAYVGELEVALSEQFALGLTQQWDPTIDATTLSGLRAVWSGKSGVLLNMAYRYRRDVLEQTDASFVIPVNSKWRLVGRWNYSLRDESTLESFAGIEWEGCCIAARLLGRHYIRNREGETNNAIYLELELKGLASFGRDSRQFLEQAILGYTR